MSQLKPQEIVRLGDIQMANHLPFVRLMLISVSVWRFLTYLKRALIKPTVRA